MIKITAAIAILLLAANSFALDCSNKALETTAVHVIPGQGYWMQASGDCRLTYTGWGGINSKLFNLCTEKPEPISNHYDACAIPGDDDLYVHPGIAFYKISDTLRLNGTNQPIYTDSVNSGMYESVAQLPGSTANDRKVRIAVGYASGAFRDYRIQKTGAEYKIEPIGERVKACSNLPSNQLDSEIPVISKDGSMISSRDQETRKTKIYKIEMPGGNCTLLATVPIKTNKVSFNFDNKSITFVGGETSSDENRRLMQMDIATGTVEVLSSPFENVLYQSHKNDGTIMYTRTLEGQTFAQSSSTSELVMLKPNNIKYSSAPVDYEALGLMWGDACHKPIDSLDDATAVGRRIGYEACNEVIKNKNDNGLGSDYSAVSMLKLKAICESKKPTVANGATPGTATGTR